MLSKNVLLPECKRHTARHVALHPVLIGWGRGFPYPVTTGGGGSPGYPCQLDGVPPIGQMGYPPPLSARLGQPSPCWEYPHQEGCGYPPSPSWERWVPPSVRWGYPAAGVNSLKILPSVTLRMRAVKLVRKEQ